MSLTTIWSHKMRSGLTLLGVVIGVAAIIGMMAIITGLQKKIDEELSGLSAGVFQIQRFDNNVGFSHQHRDRTRPPIKWDYIRYLQDLPSVGSVGAEAWQWGQVIVTSLIQTNPNVTVAGGTSEFALNNGYTIEKGRFFTESEVNSKQAVAVLGSKLADKLFSNREPVGQWLRIRGRPFQIIGVFTEKAEMFDGGDKNFFVSIPLSAYENIFGLERGVFITVSSRTPAMMDEAMEESRILLRSIRHLKPQEPDNFAIWNNQQILDTFNNFTKWIKAAAMGIVAVSLLVAGIGIMNIMLVSVTERTREIGVRKALGSRRRDILFQFLVEAVVLSEIGALFGMLLGIGGPLILSAAVKFPVGFPVWTIVLALIFCSFVGVIFGIWPAMKASRLDPIEALRYE
ncbi:MAG: ABC transporter permease [bacterium]|nr:ABC transporter permease [bacterium]